PVDDGSAAPGSLHFGPGGETQSFRPRRRRRRRGGGGGGGQGAPGQSGDGQAAPVELPPAATG
ncbi:MAG: ATP-dependent helicase, partial [Candidatus Dormibacteraeota bacterium]|nr:ATP-dependent helicase [Candidatus Dormibacteraeota bacterium]